MISVPRYNLCKLKNYLKYHTRLCNFKISSQALKNDHDPKVSVRQQEWKLTQERYSKHPFILYSTKIEEQVEFMNYRRLRSLKYQEYKREKRKLLEIQRQPLNYERELVYNANGLNENFPINWMEDYEFFEGNSNRNEQHPPYGTPDPQISPSSVPCSGCGAPLHCRHITSPGYIPSEIFKGRSEQELHTIICQRCHFLKNYNIALDIEIDASTYVETISRIKVEYALAIVIVDLLDFPCSIWPGLREILGQKRPVFIVGNKVDLLPRDHNNYLNHIKDCLKDQILQCGFDLLNVKQISLISAKTGYGIEELITQLHKIWAYKGDVYLIGCTNVGKSTLFNILLNSDYCRPEATELVRRATTCPWPGTTLQMLRFPIYRPSDIRIYQRFRRLSSERVQKHAENYLRRRQAQTTGSTNDARLLGAVGRTFVKSEERDDAINSALEPIARLKENVKDYRQSKWCYDTPGVIHPHQFTELLTTTELQKLAPDNMIIPRGVRVKPGMTIFLGGLARLDFINCKYVDIDWVKVIVFSSLQIPLVVTHTENAEQMYNEYLGTEVLGLPQGDKERLARWPGLESNNEILQLVGKYEDAISSEIVFSSAGWVGLRVPFASECAFKAWTPYARGIYERTPPLVPYAERLLGKRIRNSLAYNVGKAFVFKK